MSQVSVECVQVRKQYLAGRAKTCSTWQEYKTKKYGIQGISHCGNVCTNPETVLGRTKT